MKQVLDVLRETWLDLLAVILPVRCVGCGRWDRLLCNMCLRVIKRVAEYKAPYPYKGLLGNILRAIKHDEIPRLARSFAPLMHRLCADVPETAVWVPVPSIPQHIRDRGFDHLHLLLKAGHVPRNRIVKALKTTPGRKAQVGLDAENRKRNARLIQVRKKYLPILQNAPCVIVFDDVKTTGASVAKAVEILRESGVKNVQSRTLLAV